MYKENLGERYMLFMIFSLADPMSCVLHSEIATTSSLLPHRRRSPLTCLNLLALLFVDALVQEFGIFGLFENGSVMNLVLQRGHKIFVQCTYGSFLLSLVTATLESLQMTLVLQTLWCDKTLNAWSFGVRFGALFLGLHFAADNEFTYLDELVRYRAYDEWEMSARRLPWSNQTSSESCSPALDQVF